MPIYEFHCKGCLNDIELLMKSGEPVPKCPVCNKDNLVKTPSKANFRFLKRDFSS